MKSARRTATLTILVALVSACAPRELPSRPPIAEEHPGPGEIHLVSQPRQAPYPLVLRYLSPGGDVSRVYHEFSRDEDVLVIFTDLPGERGIQTNGHACEGRYMVETAVQTDLLLHLGDGTCRVEVLGPHPQGKVHRGTQAEPRVDGH